MKRILVLIAFISQWAIAQDPTPCQCPETPAETEISPWTNALMAGLYVNQAKTSENWNAGHTDMWSWVARVNGKTQWENEKWVWFWMADLEYGLSKTNGEPMIKFTDKILTESVGARKLTKIFNAYLGIKFESQFDDGYGTYTDESGNERENTVISYFMNPGFLTESIGLGYVPNTNFSQRVGFAVKQTFASEYRRKYADDPETPEIETVRVEPGLELITEANYAFNQMVKWTSVFRLFANFESVESTDLSLNNTLAASITKYLEMNFAYTHLYDQDLDVSLQTKQTFSLGLTWNIF